MIMVNGKPINYARLPEHMRGAFERWIEHGIKPGSFGMAVITNDLFRAFGQADEINLARMKDIISFFYNDAPADCYGSREKAIAWSRQRRQLANETEKPGQ